MGVSEGAPGGDAEGAASRESSHGPQWAAASLACAGRVPDVRVST